MINSMENISKVSYIRRYHKKKSITLIPFIQMALYNNSDNKL